MNKLVNRISKNLLAAMVFLLCLFPLLTSCSAADTPPPSVTPAPSGTPIPTKTPTKATITLHPTYTSTLIPTRGTPTITVRGKVSYYSELPPGSYLLFSPRYMNNEVEFNVISVDGQIESEYLDWFGGWIAPGGKEIINVISADKEIESEYLTVFGNWIAPGGKENTNSEATQDDNYMYTYDMVTEQIIDVHPFPENFLFESWSPDRQLFVGDIGTVYDWKTDTYTSIANGTFPDGAPFSPSFPSWSPDGKWITFYAKGFEYRPQGGVYAIDTACLETEEPACWETAIGPLLPFGSFEIVWDPNSHYIAIVERDNTIQIYDFETGQSKTVIQVPYQAGDVKYITWTADGKNIAYTTYLDSTYMNLYLIPIAGGEPTLLREDVLSVRTWLEVPEPVEE